MTLRHPLSIVAALAFAGAAHAAAPQESAQQSACTQAVEGDAADAAARRNDADIDGNGACGLSDGGIRKESRRNTGVSASDSWHASLDDPEGRRFGFGSDGHRLGMRSAVVTLDAGDGAQGMTLDGWGSSAATDLFKADDTWHWPADALPGYVDGATTEAGFVAVAAPVSAFALAAPDTLTSRTGGVLDDVATSPAPVPEPGTWAMLLAGLAMLAALARRRS